MPLSIEIAAKYNGITHKKCFCAGEIIFSYNTADITQSPVIPGDPHYTIHQCADVQEGEQDNGDKEKRKLPRALSRLQPAQETAVNSIIQRSQQQRNQENGNMVWQEQ